MTAENATGEKPHAAVIISENAREPDRWYESAARISCAKKKPIKFTASPCHLLKTPGVR